MNTDSRFRLGERWVDPSADEIDGARVDARAMEVLVALVETAPDVLSVAALLERVWPNVVVGDNVVHQAIAQLRRALGDDARSPRYIESVPRRGYRIIADIGRNEPNSIAVLRFADMSPERDQAPLCEGIADEILNRLVQIHDLKVIARTSSFQFDPSHTNVREISQRLGVRHVLEGSVRTAGKQVRITAQLIECEGESHRWSESYTRELVDLFTLYDEVADAITRALDLVISEDRPKAITAPTRSEEALNLVMQAQFRLEETGDPRSLFRLVERAIALDPDYADAHCARGKLFYYLADALYGPPESGYLAARECLERTLLLDPNFANAHQLMGWIRAHLDLDWGSAAESWRQADRLRGYSNKYVQLFQAGYYVQAERNCRQNMERDPLNAHPRAWLGRILVRLERIEEATREMEVAIDLAPHDRTVFGNFIVHLVRFTRDLDRAERLIDKTKSIGAWSPFMRALVAHERGDNGPLSLWVETIIGRRTKHYVSARAIANAYYDLGQYGEHIKWFVVREREKDYLSGVPRMLRDHSDYWDRLTDWALDEPGRARPRMALVNEHRARIDRMTERMVLPLDYVE